MNTTEKILNYLFTSIIIIVTVMLMEMLNIEKFRNSWSCTLATLILTMASLNRVKHLFKSK